MTEKTDSKEREAFVEWMIADVLRSATKPVSDGMRDALRQTASQVWDSGEELVVRGWKARASLAASAGSEPVAYAMFADNGNIRLWSKARIPHPDAKPLYLHPSPPEGMVGGWMPIETAPEGQMVVVGWLDPEDPEHPERHDFDLLEDGCWQQWHERAEHVEVIGGHGVSYTPPYTVWMPVSPIPTTSATSGKGGVMVERITPAGLVEWLAGGRRGISSNTIVQHLTGWPALKDWHPDIPHDPSDLDRCLQLLAQVPMLRLLMPRMATCSPMWAALMERWDEIEACHLEEVGLGWTKAKSAPKTYDLMRSVIDAARKKDPS